MPRKHVLIGEGFYIIDYDRSHFSHNPGNLTQALHFVIHHLGIHIDKLINEMKKYKHTNIEWKREELFIEILNKLGMSDLYETLRSLRDEELNRIIFRGISNDYLNVFRALGQIKKGNTLTYKELGIMLDMHARKVARILARNPLLIMIPCHRVVGVNDMGGYVLGVKRKKELLLQEAMP
ncbi:methylated-DNA--[protein]-cysteine S-methyltransferase [Candidatus Woesearchaeota archaeon]|nr:methylated-DNA--[protein]-cysteine S-methyltransferase [Candidatus Woesearchaeota archaeon]